MTLASVQRWVRRAHGRALASVDWSDHSHAPRRRPRQCDEQKRQAIVAMRFELGQSALGYIGAAMIYEQLQPQLGRATPGIRTIGRILAQEGLLSREPRPRRDPPPKAWYLPPVATQRLDLDSCDIVEDLRVEGGPLFQVLTTRSQWNAAAHAWTAASVSARLTCHSLLSHWRKYGRPAYAQFDNGTVFQGGHNWPDTFGQVTRFCLALGVTPVFAPPAEHGVQNLIEHFNGLWQQKVWERFHHHTLREVQRASDRFTSAWCARRARANECAPQRPALHAAGAIDLRAIPQGTVIYLRRCDESGAVHVLGHHLPVDAQWSHRLVRVEVDLNLAQIRCYGLRRHQPLHQPLLNQIPYQPRWRKTFHSPLTSITWH